MLQLEADEPQRNYLPKDITAITGRSQTTEARYLRILWEQGKIQREWNGRQYFYQFKNLFSETSTQESNSKPLSQTPMTNRQTQTA